MKQNNKHSTHVLHLARWYPNRYEPLYGLFIQRHIEAVSLFTNSTLVYTHAVTNSKLRKNYEIETNVNHDFFEIIVYYNDSQNNFLLNKTYRFLKANYLGIRKAKQSSGKFDIIHVHILTRLGIIALFLKYLWNIPYIITEHWSRYLPLTGNYKGILRKYLTKIVVKNASIITTVSKNLASVMQKRGLYNKRYVTIPNVINPMFFKSYNTKTDNVVHFVHISCFEDRSKNVSGILRAIKVLSSLRNDFRFLLIGDGMNMQKLKEYVAELNISDKIIEFTGELHGEDLAAKMAMGDMTVIFSNYENMPVVIIESFALGIPVVATRVGGISEIVDSEKGILINSKDENALVDALNNFLDNKYRFDSDKLKAFAQKFFSYQAVGKQIVTLYDAVKR